MTHSTLMLLLQLAWPFAAAAVLALPALLPVTTDVAVDTVARRVRFTIAQSDALERLSEIGAAGFRLVSVQRIALGSGQWVPPSRGLRTRETRVTTGTLTGLPDGSSAALLSRAQLTQLSVVPDGVVTIERDRQGELRLSIEAAEDPTPMTAAFVVEPETSLICEPCRSTATLVGPMRAELRSRSREIVRIDAAPRRATLETTGGGDLDVEIRLRDGTEVSFPDLVVEGAVVAPSRIEPATLQWGTAERKVPVAHHLLVRSVEDGTLAVKATTGGALQVTLRAGRAAVVTGVTRESAADVRPTLVEVASSNRRWTGYYTLTMTLATALLALMARIEAAKATRAAATSASPAKQ